MNVVICYEMVDSGMWNKVWKHDLVKILSFVCYTYGVDMFLGMSRRYTMIEGQVLPVQDAVREESSINWNLCALCQKASSSETVVCPANRDGAGYTYVGQNLALFLFQSLLKDADSRKIMLNRAS